MGGGPENRCVGRVCDLDGAVHDTIRTVHTTYAAAIIQKLGAESHILQLNI